MNRDRVIHYKKWIRAFGFVEVPRDLVDECDLLTAWANMRLRRTTSFKFYKIKKKQERRRDREFAEYLEERAIDSEINETKAERFQNV